MFQRQFGEQYSNSGAALRYDRLYVFVGRKTSRKDNSQVSECVHVFERLAVEIKRGAFAIA